MNDTFKKSEASRKAENQIAALQGALEDIIARREDVEKQIAVLEASQERGDLPEKTWRQVAPSAFDCRGVHPGSGFTWAWEKITAGTEEEAREIYLRDTVDGDREFYELGGVVEIVEADEAPVNSPEDLKRTFELVQNPDDWKDEINAAVDSHDVAVLGSGALEILREAVIHFTGTVPTITSSGGTMLHVRADGYRRGPCGDR